MGLLSILDTILFGVRRIYWGLIGSAVEMPERPALNFEGDGVTCYDDPTTNRTRVVIGPSVGGVPATRKILGDEGISVTPAPGTLDTDLTVKLVVINDTQHGERNGGSLHSLAVAGDPGTAGFISGASQLKLDSMPDPGDIATEQYVDDAIAAIPANTAATLEDTDTAVNPNGVAIRALQDTLGFVGVDKTPVSFLRSSPQATTQAQGFIWGRLVSDASGHSTTSTATYQSVQMPSFGGTPTEVGRWLIEWTNAIGAKTKQTWYNYVNSLTAWMVVGTDNKVTWPAYTSAGLAHFNASGVISTSLLVNADVDAAANISCQKTDGDFGSTVVKANGFLGPKIDTNGAAVFQLCYIGDATGLYGGKPGFEWLLFDSVVVRNDAITTTTTAGLITRNDTASDAVNTVHRPAAIGSEGTAWMTGGGGSSKVIRYLWELVPRSGGSTAMDVVLRYDSGGGTYNTGPSFTTQDSLFGGTAWVAPMFLATVNGYRIDQGSGNGGGIKNTGNDIVVESQGSGNTLRVRTNGTDRIYIDGSGKGRDAYVPVEPTSASNAVTFNLDTSKNVEHVSTENTTVSFSGGTVGQEGVILITQGASGKTFTFPGDGSGVEYAKTPQDLKAMVVANTLVDTTAFARTLLKYYIMKTSPSRIFIYDRATEVIP